MTEQEYEWENMAWTEGTDEDDGWSKEILSECLKHANNQVKGYKAFLEYLHDECIGDKNQIIEAVAEARLVDFIGYVDGELSVEKNELYVTVEVPDRCGFNGKETCKIKCNWQASSNYAVHQRCEFEDSYYGWLLFPTYNFKKWYCVYYSE